MTQRKAAKVHVAQLTPAANNKPEIVKVDDSTRLIQIRALVEANNKSTLSTDLIICQIYMESRFDARAGATQDAHGLMQMQRKGVQQVFKYRKQKLLGHMPSDAQTKAAFAEGATLHASDSIYDEATNIGLGTEYMQYWADTSPSVAAAYARYRGVANGIYYKKISACAERLQADPTSMKILREMVK
ncbi:transglycosylase SLT domain-containing protein [Duganella violaceipulchra]|uniref:Lytic transglycosylase domain-containing protein n=1 Tax=Duganella violaceipulchra TaxID=2849652 RepID=A0AA41HB21_9BURK|nr:transglycosylase SLT domain-containing protein [Duganella violaceicalia]MBV6325263.1 lytic transglycosylase domain-containing protein [Duganella violaceicalia]MCP2012476.1 soluble lytic murein transglycosylase-like protein [Duganella violaceicalia]